MLNLAKFSFPLFSFTKHRWEIGKKFPFCQSTQSKCYCFLQLFYFFLLLNHNYNWIPAQFNTGSLHKWAEINWKSFQTKCHLLYRFTQMAPLLLQDLWWNDMPELQGQPNTLWLCTSSFMGSCKHFSVTHNVQVSAQNFQQRFKNSDFWFPLPWNLTCSPL